jgi:hypothetical protein
MGKSFRRDSKNDRWRKAKQQKSVKKSSRPRDTHIQNADSVLDAYQLGTW